MLGFDIEKHPPNFVQDRISYMPQRFRTHEATSVPRESRVPMPTYGVPKKCTRQGFKRYVGSTGSYSVTQRLAGQLSGGMKQKLGLACTLVRSPSYSCLMSLVLE